MCRIETYNTVNEFTPILTQRHSNYLCFFPYTSFSRPSMWHVSDRSQFSSTNNDERIHAKPHPILTRQKTSKLRFFSSVELRQSSGNLCLILLFFIHFLIDFFKTYSIFYAYINAKASFSENNVIRHSLLVVIVISVCTTTFYLHFSYLNSLTWHTYSNSNLPRAASMKKKK